MQKSWREPTYETSSLAYANHAYAAAFGHAARTATTDHHHERSHAARRCHRPPDPSCDVHRPHPSPPRMLSRRDTPREMPRGEEGNHSNSGLNCGRGSLWCPLWITASGLRRDSLADGKWEMGNGKCMDFNFPARNRRDSADSCTRGKREAESWKLREAYGAMVQATSR